MDLWKLVGHAKSLSIGKTADYFYRDGGKTKKLQSKVLDMLAFSLELNSSSEI